MRTAFLLTGDRGHAEDLVQLALERTARRWSALSGSPEAFARTVLLHAAADRWRRRRARAQEVFDDAVDEPSIADGVDQLLLRRDLVGLGLAIVNSITQAHDGTLTLSPRDGGGLRVSVQLPAAPDA